MSAISPNKILLRLRELKIWQENQEEILKQKSTNNNKTQSISIVELSSSDESTVKTPTNWDLQPITPTKSFDKLLEEKLLEAETESMEVVQKPKKPFLRKGTGLQRYGIKPGNIRRKSPPKKNKPISSENKENINRIKQPENDNFSPLTVPEFVLKPRGTWRRVLEENSIEKSHNISAQSVEKDLLVFEALEQRVDHSSFCSTNSSIIQILSSTPSKLAKATPVVIHEEKRVHFDKTDEGTSEPKPDNFFDMERWSSNESIPSHISTTSSSSVTSSDLQSTLKTTELRDASINTDNDICLNCGTQIQNIIMEYDKEIDTIREEKDRIVEIRKELQTNLELFEREQRKRYKEFEEEKLIFLTEFEAEKKKLTKEKMVFETYVKGSQSRPNKKEREEISNLKKELADVKELLKLKESKNGVTQARLRTQIKQLEKDNSSLKDEIERLTKENAKLLATQKVNRRPSDTKMLHEINKNLTKLTQEAFKKQKNLVTTSNKASDSEQDEEDKSLSKRKSGKDSQRVNSTDMDMTSFKNLSHINVEKQYEHVFGNDTVGNQRNNSLNDTKKPSPDRVEEMFEDGTKEIRYSNGNVKTISADGNLIIMKYYNGDVKQTNLVEGFIKYFYNDKGIWHTNFSDGSELIEYPNGSNEKKHRSGKCEIFFPDGVVKTVLPDGTEEIKYPDGSVLNVNGDERVLYLTNGQKEIHTKNDKRREYPDGTVKILYPDGTQETRYANGRVRIKDSNGVLIRDTHDT